jgi:hypothetical protein
MLQPKKRPDTPLAATPRPAIASVSTLTPAGKSNSMKPSAAIPTIRRTPTKEERTKAVWTPSYNKSKEKASGDSYEQWYDKFTKRTEEQARKNPEPKSERTFFAKDNGPKSPCKGGKCSK